MDLEAYRTVTLQTTGKKNDNGDDNNTALADVTPMDVAGCEKGDDVTARRITRYEYSGDNYDNEQHQPQSAISRSLP